VSIRDYEKKKRNNRLKEEVSERDGIERTILCLRAIPSTLGNRNSRERREKWVREKILQKYGLERYLFGRNELI